MDININLNYQPEKRRTRKYYQSAAIITLVLAITTGIVLISGVENHNFLIWFYMIYFSVFSISYYYQAQGKFPIDLLGKSYLKLNDRGIVCKPKMFSKELISVLWEDIDDIKIKLFEIRIKTENHWISVDLEKLSDNNLKLVKQTFRDFQAKQSKEVKSLEMQT